MLELLRGDAKSERDERDSADARDLDEEDTHRERAITCRACGHGVTSASAWTEVNGKHAHVHVNPSGIPFDIGCFRDAPGTVGVGPFETHWTWFPGHAWQIAVCGGCRAHLGWAFRSPSGEGFHGLVLARLAEREDG
jgi:hypothetical protein